MVRTRILTSLVMAAVCVSGATTATGADRDEKDWVKLGEMKVSRDVDRDDLNVGKRADYSRLRFRVEGSAVHFGKCKVHFLNGGVQTIDIDKTVKAGEGTGPLDLVGKERHIKHITIWYKTVGRPAKGEGKVTAWGLK